MATISDRRTPQRSLVDPSRNIAKVMPPVRKPVRSPAQTSPSATFCAR